MRKIYIVVCGKKVSNKGGIGISNISQTTKINKIVWKNEKFRNICSKAIIMSDITKISVKLVFISLFCLLLILNPVLAGCGDYNIINVEYPKEVEYNQNFNVTITVKSVGNRAIVEKVSVRVKVGLNNSNRDNYNPFESDKSDYVFPKQKRDFNVSYVNFDGLYDEGFEKWKRSDSRKWNKSWIEVVLVVKGSECPRPKKIYSIILKKPPYPPKLSVEYNNSMRPGEILFDYIIDRNDLNKYIREKRIGDISGKHYLKLEVYNFSVGEYESKGVVTFDDSEDVRWLGVKLKSDNFERLEGKCRIIINNKTTLCYSKPVIFESFKELEATPPTGKPNNRFTFKVTFKSSICEKIKLLVYNYTSKSWDVYGEKIYNKPGEEVQLEWEDVILNENNLNRSHDGMYKFVSMLLESNETEGPFYDFNFTITNFTVTPKRGLYSDEYKYSVDVFSERPLDLELRVTSPSGEEINKFAKYSNTNHLENISWKIKFEKRAEGNVTAIVYAYYKGEKINRAETHEPYVGIAEFRNNTIKPKIGTRDTNFLFCIECRAAEGISDHVYLEVYDSKGNRDKQINLSNVSPNWKKFCFNYVPKNVDLGATKYRFSVANTYSEEYEGPMVVEEILSNFQVNPDNGTNQTEFTFKVYPSIKPIEIINETYNITLQLSVDKINWIDVMEKPYDKCVVFQNISIDSLNLADKSKIISEWKQKGTLYWRIRGYVTNSNIVETKWDIDLKFLNHSFSPKKAWWNDSLFFTTTLSAKANGFVELQLKTDNGNILNLTILRKEYNNTPNNQTFNWTINLEKLGKKEYEGKVKYRFIFYWGDTKIESRWYDGPTLYKHLKVNVTSASVYPASGYSGCLPKYFEPIVYHYCINLSANKNTIVKLIVISPSGKRLEMNGKEYTRGKSKEIIWESKENQSLTYNELGTWTYVVNCSYFDPKQNRFVEKEYYRCNGPRVYAFLNNFTIEPKYVKDGMLMYGDKINISFDVKSVDNISVTLYILTQGKKHRVDSRNVHMNTTTKLYFLNIDPIKYLKNTGSFSFLLGVNRW